MKENRYLRKGSVVTISLMPGDARVTPGMLNYDGESFPISKVCKTKKIYTTDNMAYGYELEGVVSEFGVPYTFTREMIF